jgi:hypothetical protein
MSSSSWIQPDWILRPPLSVKPLRDPETSGEHFIEHEQDKTTYTLDDRAENVESLAANYDGLARYLREIGLIRKDARALIVNRGSRGALNPGIRIGLPAAQGANQSSMRVDVQSPCSAGRELESGQPIAPGL